MRPERMTFGIFMAPFHRVGEHPTLALERDLELVEWLDALDYDEAWFGEHHSGGWEIIADPAIMIASAAARTRKIRLGSGVVSLPYHHPLMVADRWVQLDHLTRGRAMLGVGPGALASDAYMMGIRPETQRPRMDEALGVILRLLTGEVVDYQSDWFELNHARLQLLPYTRPHFPIAVASTFSPSGMMTAGRHGVGVLSIGAGLPGGTEALPRQWAIAEEHAAKAGTTVRREDWRLVMAIHIADSRKEAIQDIELGRYRETTEYFQETLGNPQAAVGLEKMIEAGGALIGSPDDAIATVERLLEHSGGFGGLLGVAHDWTTREKTQRSYELFARYVMPRFQNLLPPIEASNQFVRENKRDIFAPSATAITNAFRDAGREVPPELVERFRHRSGQ